MTNSLNAARTARANRRTEGGSRNKSKSLPAGSRLERRSVVLSLMAGDVLTTTYSTMMSKTEGGDENSAISNATCFLTENNSNYDYSNNPTVDGYEVFADPSNPPTKGCNRPYAKWLIGRFVYHIGFRLFTLFLILFDVGILTAAAVIDCNVDRRVRIINGVDVALSTYFLFEMGLRIYAVTPKVLFSRRYWFNWIDLTLVVVFFILSVANMAWTESFILNRSGGEAELGQCTDSNRGTAGFQYSTIFIGLRVFRYFRLLRVLRIYTEHHQLKRGMRQLVSKNKRRYREDGADLDLTFITANIIAMSFPSTGWRAWYRNNIGEVARFLDEKHGDRYRVYNLCSERSYPVEPFHGKVFRFPMEDHNVPSVAQIISFVHEVTEWLNSDPRNVVAVHCKGGKGRTGTMICILLIKIGLFKDAERSLEYFGERRTDANVSSQFQGVETASQIRYVTYFEKLLASCSSSGRPISYPNVTDVALAELMISGVSGIGKGDGSDLRFEIDVRDDNDIPKSVFDGRVQLGNVDAMQTSGTLPCASVYNKSEDILVIGLPPNLRVHNDVRLKFHCSSSAVPKGYLGCAFYFWFHTSFLPHEKHGNWTCLKLEREELDNPHKPKTWDIYSENFSVHVHFAR